MPKAKPDQVIVHRLELQESERRMIETAIAAYSIRNVSRGIFNLTSDVTTVVILAIFLEWLTGKEILKEGWNTAGDLAGDIFQSWKDYRNTPQYAQEYNERATSVTGGLHNIWDQFWGALTGATLESWQDRQNEQSGGGGGGF